MVGSVEWIDNLPEIDLFVLFNSDRESESPYAAVIYPKEKGQKLSRAIAQKWSDRIFPKSARGKVRENLGIYRNYWYQRGYIDYGNGDRHDREIDRVIIGYRSDTVWNPKQFL
jgi:hypothetical protein